MVSSPTCRWCGRELFVQDDAEYYPCGCDEKFSRLSGTLALPPALARADHGSLTPALRPVLEDYLENFDAYAAEGTGLWIRGPHGVGKTFGLAWLARELVGRLTPVRFLNVVRLFVTIREGWKDNRDEVVTLSDTAVLIIDDLGKEYLTDWKREVLYYLFDTRSTELRPTLVSTNLPGDELADILGPFIVDRIRERSIPCILEGTSRRRPPRKGAS